MRNLARFLLLATLLVDVAQAQRSGERISLAPAGRDGLSLVSSPGTAQVQFDNGHDQRIPLEKNQVLTAIAETDPGWIATGTRPSRTGIDLVLYRGGLRRPTRLQPPRGPKASIRLRAVPMVGEDGLAGLVWLQGDDFKALSVASAEWTGGAWSNLAQVSKPGPGSQSGLTGAILSDGSWLIVWAGFDGADDELFWASREDGAWTLPRRLTFNRESDVTPSLIPSRNGALLAWNQMTDQGSLVMQARFHAGSWTAIPSSAPSNSFKPVLLERGEEIFLQYRQGQPAGWAVAVLDSEGLERRRVFAENASKDRPAPVPMGEAGVLLRWHKDAREELIPWEPAP